MPSKNETPQFCWEEGRALAAEGKLEAAADRLADALAIDPDFVPALHDLPYLLVHLGRHAAALQQIRTLVAKGSECPIQIHHLHARVLVNLRSWQEALTATESGLLHAPDDGELTALRGAALRNLGRADESLLAQERLLDVLPDCVPAKCEKGWALLTLRRPDEALAIFDDVLEQDDRVLSALAGMGVAELHAGMPAAAVAALDQVLVQDPDSFEGHFYRAVALQELGRDADARLGFVEVLRRWPSCAEAHANLGSIERDAGNLAAAIEHQRHAVRIAPGHAEAHSNLLVTLLYAPAQTPEALFREHVNWGERFGSPPERFTEWLNDRGADRRLRIGIVSAELVKHAVSAWLEPVLANLDRRRFEVFCYATRPQKDQQTERFQRLADGWRDVARAPVRALAETIRADEIDILLDLSGHTAHNRLPVFALKPAPVQASWLGYPFTTGLAAIDYVITDSIAVRPGEEGSFVEQVIRLPGGRIVHRPPSSAPEVAEPPALRQGWITFGSFNSITKINDDVLDTWCELLVNLPMTRLLLKTPALASQEVADRVRRQFCARGLASGRLELRGPSPSLEVMAQYADIDIALDPFPFGGGVTSCEVLWMGVPLVTLPSWQPVSRQSEGFLRAIGRPEWVAQDHEDYVRIAMDLARDPQRLAEWRRTQRETMRASPLCDEARMAREFGDALRGMWQAYAERPLNCR
jgi:predicted O-linked N-acetylglucosamine transferase (SPINDLY family)